MGPRCSDREASVRRCLSSPVDSCDRVRIIPKQVTVSSELVRTRGIRLFN